VEHALLERLDSDAYGLVYVARELRFMSSTQSIKALEDLLGSSTLDVRCVALDSLGERLGAGVLPFARRFSWPLPGSMVGGKMDRSFRHLRGRSLLREEGKGAYDRKAPNDRAA